MMRVALIACALLAVVAQGQTIPERVLSRRRRIISGTDAILGEIPYQVSLKSNRDSWVAFCSGSILNEHWIITAAHCVPGKDVDYFTIIAGTVDLKKPFSIHYAEKIISHPGYRLRNSVINDVALIKVDPPFNFSSSIKQAVLPEPHAEVIINSTATISGWGYTNHSRLTDKLKKATVYITDPKICKEAVRRESTIHPTQFCTNHPSTGGGACTHDSGGPVVINDVTKIKTCPDPYRVCSD